MHDIFGAEVIEIFDMKYGNYSVQAEAFTAETVKKWFSNAKSGSQQSRRIGKERVIVRKENR